MAYRLPREERTSQGITTAASDRHKQGTTTPTNSQQAPQVKQEPRKPDAERAGLAFYRHSTIEHELVISDRNKACIELERVREQMAELRTEEEFWDRTVQRLSDQLTVKRSAFGLGMVGCGGEGK